MLVCVFCLSLLSSTQGPCNISESARLAAAKAASEPDDATAAGQQDPAAPGGLYSLLDAQCQSIVAPFLTTRFTQTPGKSNDTSAHHAPGQGVDEWEMTLRWQCVVWLPVWLRWLLDDS